MALQHETSTEATDDEHHPSLPIPIFRISSKIEKYLLYDINTITWLRRTHNILGVLIGTLPQFPQQNVFLGLPLELQPEEVHLLVEKKVAYLVSDREWHERGGRLVTAKQRKEFLESLWEDGMEVARGAELRKEVAREKTMRRLEARKRGGLSAKAAAVVGGGGRRRGSVADEEKPPEANDEEDQQQKEEEEESEFLFTSSPLPSLSTPNLPSTSSTASTQPPTTTNNPAQTPIVPWTITPTTSYPSLPPPHPDSASPLPSIHPPSYALFKHLHSKSYYISPGLRFGCQFLVYPGDPLRFHSHFLAVGMDWEEEFDLLDLVGGGRLGTGVKKGWLVGGLEGDGRGDGEVEREGEREGEGGGGKEEGGGDDGLSSSSFDKGQAYERTDGDDDAMMQKLKQNQVSREPRVRTFCLEWGGM